MHGQNTGLATIDPEYFLEGLYVLEVIALWKLIPNDMLRVSLFIYLFFYPAHRGSELPIPAVVPESFF